MADKSRNLFPIDVTFSDGEMPDSTKMSAISRQAKGGLAIAEYMIGDVWNQSGDSFFQSIGVSTTALMIPNLARYVGGTKDTSPFIPYLPNITRYTYNFILDTATEYETQLTFPPAAGATWSDFIWTGTSHPTASQKKTNAYEVDATGDWWIDSETGHCRFYDPIQTDWAVTYPPRVDGDQGSASTFNIIPDPRQETAYNFGGCKIAYANNTDNSQGYIIYLPPRGPLQSSKQFSNQYPQSTYDVTGNTSNEAATVDSGAKKFWQRGSSGDTASTAAGYAEHYRYNLPTLLTDNWSQNSLLPTGFLYLWDHTQTGTVVEGVTFRAENAASPKVWAVVASGTGIDTWVSSYLTSAGYPSDSLTQRDNHDESYYPAAGLRLIAVGQDMSSAIMNIQKRLMDHDHGSSSSMPTTMVNHNKLKGLFDAADEQVVAASVFSTLYLGYGLVDYKLHPSYLEDDDHPQYLHRMGSSGGSYRDRYNGGMLGDICLLSEHPGSGDHSNLSGNSRKLVFGDPASGPNIRYHADTDTIQVGTKAISAVEGFRAAPAYDGTYGWSAGLPSDGYGEVRTLIIPPKDFLQVISGSSTVTSADPAYMSNNYSTTGIQEDRTHIASTDDSGSNPDKWESMSLRLGRQSLARSFLWTNPSLPFAKWCIVNVWVSCSPRTVSLTSGAFYAAIGYDEYHSTGYYPNGTKVAGDIDFYSVYGALASGWWGAPAPLFSSPNPLIEIDNTVGAASAKVPWIRFQALAGTAGHDLFIGHVTLLYRVKEF